MTLETPRRLEGQTNWGVLGAGEGGNRIASLFLDKKHASVGARIALINTASADMENVYQETMRRIGALGAVVPEIKVVKQNFGDNTGAGNDPFEGERFAAQYFDSVILRALRSAGIDKADAMLSICALGGGTGNGSVPYIIRAAKDGGGAGLQDVRHFALAAWPYDNEPPQRHANALAGLSRLLMREDTGQRNADFVLLCDNNRLRTIASEETEDPDFTDINKPIWNALDLLTIGGQGAEGVMDVKNFIQLAHKQVGLHHFTCGVSLDNDPDVVSLEKALDFALKGAFMTIDPKTVTMAFLVVRVPPRLKGQDEFTYKGILDTFERWHAKRMNVQVGMHSLVTAPGTTEGFDVLLVLGGFDIKPLVTRHRAQFERQLKLVENNPGEEKRADRLRLILGRLDDYLGRMDRVLSIVGAG